MNIFAEFTLILHDAFAHLLNELREFIRNCICHYKLFTGTEFQFCAFLNLFFGRIEAYFHNMIASSGLATRPVSCSVEFQSRAVLGPVVLTELMTGLGTASILFGTVFD